MKKLKEIILLVALLIVFGSTENVWATESMQWQDYGKDYGCNAIYSTETDGIKKYFDGNGEISITEYIKRKYANQSNTYIIDSEQDIYNHYVAMENGNISSSRTLVYSNGAGFDKDALESWLNPEPQYTGNYEKTKVIFSDVPVLTLYYKPGAKTKSLSDYKRATTIFVQIAYQFSGSTYDKVLQIHDWICTNVNYDYSTPINHAEWTDALIYNKAVCRGYTDLFQKLCDVNGIECYSIGGDTEFGGHAWNIVNIDGNNYHVDCTWDGSDNTLSHKYFLIGRLSPNIEYYNYANCRYTLCDSDYSPQAYVSSEPSASISIENATKGVIEREIEIVPTIEESTELEPAENPTTESEITSQPHKLERDAQKELVEKSDTNHFHILLFVSITVVLLGLIIGIIIYFKKSK